MTLALGLSRRTSVTTLGRRDKPSVEGVVLRGLEWVANPMLAGLAWLVLSLGVVTWLPALAAAAHALRQWRYEDEQRCFTGVFAAFGGYWRALWRHSVVSTVVLLVLFANVIFLSGRVSLAGFLLLAVQLGIVAAMIPYHLALAAVAGTHPANPDRWRSAVLILAFGSWRGPLLLAATVSSVAVAPLLFGPAIPLVLALALERGAR